MHIVNLADLHGIRGRDSEGDRWFRQGLELIPGETRPETGLWDKWEHILAYGVLAVLGGFGFKGWRSLLVVGIGLVVLGAGLELAQSVIPDRDGSTYDALANFVGVAIGSVAAVGTNTFLREQ